MKTIIRSLMLFCAMAIVSAFLTAPAQAQPYTQCDYDCGCNPATDPSCGGGGYYEPIPEDNWQPIPEDCEDSSCDPYAGDIVADARPKCGKLIAYMACLRVCRWTYQDDMSTCDDIWWSSTGRLACRITALRTYQHCVERCAIDAC